MMGWNDEEKERKDFGVGIFIESPNLYISLLVENVIIMNFYNM